MTTTKATPGPWKISEPIELSFGLWRADVFLDDFLIAEVYGNGRDETLQRGKMVATAPELRYALIECVKTFSVAKSYCDDPEWRDNYPREAAALERARAAVAKVEESK